MDIRECKNHNERRGLLEKATNSSLETLGLVFPDDTKHVHCENLIGAVAIPLGVAGPVHIKGEHIKREAYIPLATTEGALVASVNRGCKAITQSGGAVVRQEVVGATRGPVFVVKDITQAQWFKAWLQDTFDVLAKHAASTSAHLKLLTIESTSLGRHVYVRFSYDTQDAMGMNMVTIATDGIASYIQEQTGIRCLAIAGNYDTDKKPSWLNVISGRGRRCWAESIIPHKIVNDVLKSTPTNIEEVVLHKNWAGSMISGSLGFNAHFANIVAAFYAATGQDIAHVVEGSMGVTSAQVLETGDLYFSIFLPDVMIGTVGGGTKLKTQTEARSITGAKTAAELSEVLMAGVLAGELSLIASIASSTLTSAHKKLGR